MFILTISKPAKSAIEDLVRQIFMCDLNSAKGIEWLRTASRAFGDFRNKFLDVIEEKSNMIKKERAK